MIGPLGSGLGHEASSDLSARTDYNGYPFENFEDSKY